MQAGKLRDRSENDDASLDPCGGRGSNFFLAGYIYQGGQKCSSARQRARWIRRSAPTPKPWNRRPWILWEDAARLREWLLAAGALLFWAAWCFDIAATV